MRDESLFEVEPGMFLGKIDDKRRGSVLYWIVVISFGTGGMSIFCLHDEPWRQGGGRVRTQVCVSVEYFVLT